MYSDLMVIFVIEQCTGKKSQGWPLALVIALSSISITFKVVQNPTRT